MLIDSLVQYLLTSSVYSWVQNPDSRDDGVSTYHTIPYSFNNVADIRKLQQYCSIEHYQSGRTKVYDSYIVKVT